MSEGRVDSMVNVVSRGRWDPSVEVAKRYLQMALDARRLEDLARLRADAEWMLREAGVDPVRVVTAELSSDMNTLWGVLREGLDAVTGPLAEASRLMEVRRSATLRERQDLEARQRQAADAMRQEESRRRPVIELAPGVSLAFVLVPAGVFKMGSDKLLGGERPLHDVYLDDYLIGRYPVTSLQFAAFVKATGYLCHKSSIEPGDRPNLPVTFVSWEDAQAFCAWSSEVTGKVIRLPTEAEWEKAARGTDGREYPWGNATPDGQSLQFLARLEGASPRLTSSVHLVMVHLVLRTWLATSWSGARIGMTQDTISPRRLGTRLAQLRR